MNPSAVFRVSIDKGSAILLANESMLVKGILTLKNAVYVLKHPAILAYVSVYIDNVDYIVTSTETEFKFYEKTLARGKRFINKKKTEENLNKGEGILIKKVVTEEKEYVLIKNVSTEEPLKEKVEKDSDMTNEKSSTINKVNNNFEMKDDGWIRPTKYEKRRHVKRQHVNENNYQTKNIDYNGNSYKGKSKTSPTSRYNDFSEYNFYDLKPIIIVTELGKKKLKDKEKN